MEKFLSGKELWSTLGKLSKECRTRQMIAVPYVGKDSSSLLKFRKNDVLLCALTEGNSKAGNINPAEIRSLQKQGIRVYQRDILHAKIYLFGNKVVICSSNLSKHSKGVLDEAGILTNDPAVVKEVRQWFNERLGEPVTPGWLEHCEEVYRPPKGGISTGKKPVADKNQQRVWILFGSPANFPADEGKERKSGSQTAKKHLEKPKTHDIEEWRFGVDLKFTKEVKRGDLAIQVFREGKEAPYKVCPHGRVLNKKQFKNKKGKFVTYLYLEMPKEYRQIKFETFTNICADAGLILGKVNRIREIQDRAVQSPILAAVSPEKLKKK
ncbi:MAG: phospholipase D family protein [Chloroflexi bacterium]|nr:phospholipase D family protein [Chloroflexota bacterium]